MLYDQSLELRWRTVVLQSYRGERVDLAVGSTEALVLLNEGLRRYGAAAGALESTTKY